MMRALFITILAVFGLLLPARAALIGLTDAGQGARIEFHDEPGDLCKAPARMAVYFDAAGKVTAGCWVLRAGGVRVNWLDGDRDDVPLPAIRKPELGLRTFFRRSPSRMGAVGSLRVALA